MKKRNISKKTNKVVQDVGDQGRKHANHGGQPRHQDHPEFGIDSGFCLIGADG